MVAVSSWGRLNAAEHKLMTLSDRTQLASRLAKSASGPGIAYGMGRSYGDVCLNPGGLLWKTTGMDRYIALDQTSGRLICESGVLLRDIQRMAVPRGWMLPVTPGTQLITVGGAIANDVHGKNHHRFGTFGDHVRHISLVRTDGSIIECGPESRGDWFAATVGGMGLTGVIGEAEIQLRKIDGPWLAVETVPYANLDEFFQLSDEAEAGWEHTVSWADCLSGKNVRGIFTRANPHTLERLMQPGRQRGVPFVPPVSLVNNLTLRPVTSGYFNLKKMYPINGVEHYEPLFYPLDNLLNWNRLYGPRGFYQYQSVLPRSGGSDATRAMFAEIKRSNQGSFLTVLKTFGERPSVGMMSFPKAGITLALDFPNRGAKTLELFERLDAIVREAKGRLYMAKDARMSRELFESGYPRHQEFSQFRDPGISSSMSRRLMGS